MSSAGHHNRSCHERRIRQETWKNEQFFSGAPARVRRGGFPPQVETRQCDVLTLTPMDLGGPGSQLRVRTEEAPMQGRAESTYRYTVIDTVGGGGSEIQKNIISRRKLGLPKNF